MKQTENRTYPMLVRVCDFGAAHKDVFPPEFLGGQMLTVVKQAVAELDKYATSQTKSKSARAFAQDAEPLKVLFIKSAMPANFIENLNEHIQDLEEAVREHAASKENHLTATVGIEAAMDKALIAVRPLDPIIANTFRDNPVVMASMRKPRITRI